MTVASCCPGNQVKAVLIMSAVESLVRQHANVVVITTDTL